MKNLSILFLAIFLYSGISAAEKNKVKEKEAVKKVVIELTDAFRAKDFNRIENTFVQNESTIKIGSSKGSYFVRTGWEEVGSRYKQNFMNNPEPITQKLEKVNFRIKVYEKSAWSVHDEIQTLNNGNKTKQLITHFLEKNNGKWEVVFMSQIFVSSYDVAE